ncbi:MAG: 2-oxoacid:acceptor oxidoreductase subunit alpha [Candidatus Marinimicrobia bacterium]|nr:2-oxoacid:acceptor oxidoreductase subunit alpha [Candidatus Neomarinimicrobiota bacterium]MCF7850321.1 2-oxoacid:acceptor oxidoreductase subunit alpha [Candidatus Neomarinimicrobiota bacterium]
MTKKVTRVNEATIRFAGDSGDGMQLTGTRFTEATAILGNDLKAIPNYPSEIRAPTGTLAGVSAFQLMFGSSRVFTPGDLPDTLVAMNPAALKVHLKDLKKGGSILANANAFTDKNLKMAGWESNPLEDDTLAGYTVFSIEMSKLVGIALEESDLTKKEIERTKNMFALGVLFWMYNRPLEPTEAWLKKKFAKIPSVAEANIIAMRTGFNYGETTEIFTTSYSVEKAELPKGKYRNITGNEAVTYGLVAAAQKSGKELFLGSYPITPASEILHNMSNLRNFKVKTFQAEDEIAGIASAIGAAYAGDLAVTTTSGPGMALKTESIGLAVTTELPLVIVNVQRGGPSTGMPTKMEQADLFQAIMGRNGETPVPVLAAMDPADCFECAFEAARVAMKYMTPVILLSDGYLGQGSGPWKIPNPDDIPEIEISHPDTSAAGEEGFMPYQRDEKEARPWAIPGTPGLEHRIGGLEKENITGMVSQDPENHQIMSDLRARKVRNIAKEFDPLEVYGEKQGKLLVITWGSSHGSAHVAVDRSHKAGKSVSQLHLRWLNPLPSDLKSVTDNFDELLIPEVNMGQLALLLKAELIRPIHQLNKMKGEPLRASEIETKIDEILG